MALYVASFAGVAVTAAQDVFELTAPTDVRVRLRKIFLGQYTDFGDAAAEIISVQIIRGFTTSGSGGASVTPLPMVPGTGLRPRSAVARNNTTLAQNGAGDLLFADTMNIQAGWWYAPPHDEQIVLDNGNQRLVVRITAPADSITMNATLMFEEGG